MKEITREELAELVNRVSAEVSEIYTDVQDTGDKNADAVDMLAGNMAQIQRNCEKIIAETLYQLMGMGYL